MEFSLHHYSKPVLELCRPTVWWEPGKKRLNCEPDLVPSLRTHGAMSILRHTSSRRFVWGQLYLCLHRFLNMFGTSYKNSHIYFEGTFLKYCYVTST